MIFFIYLFRRFFAYLLGINFLLTTLITFIEFFEKLLHANQATTSEITYFLLLNFIPSFFEQLATSSWLATILIIKDFWQQHEWDTLKLLRISHKKILSYLAVIGCLLMTTSFCFKEKFVVPLTFNAEHFKLKKFKQITLDKLVNKWFMLDKHTFCHFSFLDLAQQKGQDLLIIYLTPTFTIEKTIQAKSFFINTGKKLITIPEGTEFNTSDNVQQKIVALSLIQPTFFSLITMNIEVPSLVYLTKNLLFNKSILPATVYQDLFAQLLKRFLGYLQLLFYPLLTFSLFCFFEQKSTLLKWIGALLPYPILTIANLIIENLLPIGVSAWFLIIPYIVSLMFIIFALKTL